MKDTMLEITIKVDTNDADYIIQVSEISSSNLEKIKPLIEEIKNFKTHTTSNSRYNYPCLNFGDYGRPKELYPNISEEVHEIFRDLCPYNSEGFHSIVSVYISPLMKKTKLF